MYKQMYEGFVEILKRGPEDEVKYMKNTEKVPYFFNLVYKFDPLDIIRIKHVHIDGISDILLILAKFPKENNNSKYADYIMYDGKLTKAILINMNDLLDEDPMVQMNSISWSIWKMAYTVVEGYMNIFDSKYSVSSVNIFYYSAAVLIIKILDKLYNTDKLSSDILSLVINNFYKNHKILPVGVESIRKAIQEIDIEMLLDYNLWDAMLTSPRSYPGAAFADYSPQEVLKIVDELKEESKDSTEDQDGENPTNSI